MLLVLWLQLRSPPRSEKAWHILNKQLVGHAYLHFKKTTTPTVPPSSLYVPYSPTKSQITWNFLGWSPITWPYHPEKKNSSAKSQWLECCPTSSKRWHQCKRPADPLWWTGQKPGPKACPACPMGSTVPSLREGATAQGSVEIGSGRSKPKFNELQIDWNPRNS